MANNPKVLVLGTAQWGWTVDAAQAFLQMDAWLAAGHRQVDAATNYPINKNPSDFRASERILGEYILAHGLRDLRITMKIGGLDNMRSPDPNLSPSFIQMIAGEYLRTLGSNLDCLMLHWDNREDPEDISLSLEALSQVQKQHQIRPGLSGIKYPKSYGVANQFYDMTFDIQLKYNVLHSDVERYLQDLPPDKHRYFAYGINAGGVKLGGLPYPSGSTFLARGGQPEMTAVIMAQLADFLPRFNNNNRRPALLTMNQLGVVFAALNPHMQGVLVGAGSVGQLLESLDWWRTIEEWDYQDVYALLKQIAR